jgi:O-methyltransferase domain
MSARDLVAAARAAAVALGVPGALGDEGRALGELAGGLGVAPRRLGWLCDLLVADRALVRDDDGRYRLVGDAPSGAAPAPGAKLVAQVIRHDRPLGLADLAGNADAARLTCHDGLTRVPEALVARLAAGVDGGALLDAGCGDGALATAVLAAAPAARAHLIDRDLRHAARLAGPRVALQAGDLATVDLPPARIVLASNVLHTMAPAAAAALVARLAAAVEPGGALVLREVALDDDRRGPRFGLAFGLAMLLYIDGELPTEGGLCAWAAAAGLAPQATRIAESTIVWAGRPG